MTPAEVVATNLARVRARIRDAGGSDAIGVVAVTKGRDANWAKAALDAGLVDLGENYAQELAAKAADLGDPRARWHFVGQLQTNKVRLVAPHVAMIQSIDRPSLVDEVARRAPGLAVMVQVDLSGAEGRGGCAPEAVAELVHRAGDAGLEVRGLMAVAPHPGSAGAGPAPHFARVAELRSQLGLAELSIGMTDDLEAAVEAGTTMVRVGRALFATIDEFRPPGSGGVARH